MILLRKIFAVLMLLACSSFASFFLENKEALAALNARELPTWRYGGTLAPAFYLNSFGLDGALSVEYRLHKNHSLDLFAASIFTQPLYEVGGNWRFFFSGDLMTSHADDFLLLGGSMVVFESFNKYYHPPRVSLGYGRDFLFFDKADFICRLEIRGSYIIGKPIPEKDAGLMVGTTNFVTYLEFSLFFF